MVEYLTNEGVDMLNDMLANGTNITFTRIALGDGELGYGQSEPYMTALIDEIADVGVAEVSIDSHKIIKIRGVFYNTELTEGFYLREKGIYASNGTNEVLFSYGNAGDGAQWIDPPSVEAVEKDLITLCTAVQDTEDEVNITIISSLTADYDETSEELILSIGASSLPVATEDTLGGVIIGDGLTVDDTGRISVDLTTISDDSEAAAAVVEAGTEELTDDELTEVYA